MQHRYYPDVDESHLGTTWSLDFCFMTGDDEEEDKMEECGYAGTAVTLKSDQEPAMMKLKLKVGGENVRRLSNAAKKATVASITTPVRCGSARSEASVSSSSRSVLWIKGWHAM